MNAYLVSKNGRFIITYNGKKILSSHDKNHMLRNWFRYFLEGKGQSLGFSALPDLIDNVTKEKVDGSEFMPKYNKSSNSMDTEFSGSVAIPTQSEFGINDRFNFITSLGQMVMGGVVNSMIISGEGGLGKTYTVMNMVRKAGLVEDVDYVRVAGFTTPKALYRTLYVYNEKTLIFDDCDAAFRDPTSANILKAALDSSKRRRISWYTERAGGGEDSLPEYFDFEGKVIFITNIPLNKFADSLRSRSYCIDLSMTFDDKIQRMEHIIADICPEYEDYIKFEALEFLKEQGPKVRNLNFRVLEKVIKIRFGCPGNWQDLAKYSVMYG